MITLKMKKQKCKQIAKISNKYFKKPKIKSKSQKKSYNKLMKEINSVCLKRNNLENENVLKIENRKMKKLKQNLVKAEKRSHPSAEQIHQSWGFPKSISRKNHFNNNHSNKDQFHYQQ